MPSSVLVRFEVGRTNSYSRCRAREPFAILRPQRAARDQVRPASGLRGRHRLQLLLLAGARACAKSTQRGSVRSSISWPCEHVPLNVENREHLSTL